MSIFRKESPGSNVPPPVSPRRQNRIRTDAFADRHKTVSRVTPKARSAWTPPKRGKS